MTKLKNVLNKSIFVGSVTFLLFSFTACSSDNIEASFFESSNLFSSNEMVDNTNGIWFQEIDINPDELSQIDNQMKIVYYRGINNLDATETYYVNYNIIDEDTIFFSVPDYNGNFKLQIAKSGNTDVNQVIVFLNDVEIQTLDLMNN